VGPRPLTGGRKWKGIVTVARDFSSIGVVGLGTMGAGIAEVFAGRGLSVVAVELDPSALERGRGHVEKSTGRAVTRGRMSADDQRALLDRITFATELAALADVDLVIEAVPERLEIKTSLFTELDRICRADAVLATNTSSLSVTDIAVATGRSSLVIGMHFFNPAPVMKLVEIVHSVLTEPDVIADVRALAERLGKTAVSVADRAGFVANRLLFGYLNQAAAMLESGRATREDIDTAMTIGAGLPMGPLALLDLIGLDTSVQVLDTIYAETRDRRYAAEPRLRHLVAAGHLGRKTGRGLYDYSASDAQAVPTAASPAAELGQVGIVGHGAPAEAIAARIGDHVVHVDPAKLKPLGGCDLILDAAGGTADEVRARFAAIGKAAASDAVLVTTAPAPTVLDCAVAAGGPHRVVGLHIVVGMHIVEPPGPAAPVATGDDGPVLAELVASVVSSAEAVTHVAGLAARMGLTVVRSLDRAGFIVEALLLPHLNDALLMRQDGYASADDIDAAMRFGCGYRFGPFALLDQLGARAVLDGVNAIYAERPEPGLAPAALLRQVAALDTLT
jgi:3-hydroxybutyryl-CoA dehydrogenase